MKKLIATALSSLMALTCVLGLTGCDGLFNQSELSSSSPASKPAEEVSVEKTVEEILDVCSSSQLTCDGYDRIKYMLPIWESYIIYNETAFFVQNQDGSFPVVKLAYPIAKSLEVRNSTLQKAYVEGEDYQIVDGGIQLLEGTDIQYLQWNEFYMDQKPTSGNTTGSFASLSQPGKYAYSNPEMYTMSTCITYVRTKEYDGPTVSSNADKLPNTMAKLDGKERLNIVFYGDSITYGACTSGWSGVNKLPNTPIYSELVTTELKEYFQYDNIQCINTAVGGWEVANGIDNMQERLLNNDPDLVVLAFGMNDAHHPLFSVEKYQSELETIMTAVRNQNPDSEFLLVAPMLANPDRDLQAASIPHAKQTECKIALQNLVEKYEGMLPSYLTWNEYYTAAIKAKEEQKYLNSLPLEFVGITAEVADGVVYCKNGKASPVEDDFVVMAHFTEKGKESAKKLKATDYTISVPDSFSVNGGTIEISYTYQPEKPDDAEEDAPMPEPITKTATVKATLEDVKVVKLEVQTNPYLVYYKAGDTFSKEGLTLLATYNDGRKSTVRANALETSDEALKVDDSAVAVTYDSMSVDVPVKVVDKADYNEGEINDIAIEGEVYVEEGKAIDGVKTTVRATYQSGNRRLLDPSKYTVEGKGVPSADSRYIITARLKGATDISGSFLTYVQKSYEAESATSVGGTTETVTDYAYADGTFTAGAQVTAVKMNKGSVTYTLQANAAVKTSASIRLANLTQSGNGISTIALNKAIRVTVNGKLVGVPAKTVLSGIESVAAGDKDKAVFYDYQIAPMCLRGGDNTVVIEFLDENNTILIDKLSTITGSAGEVDIAIGDHLTNSLLNGTGITIDTTKVADWNTFGGKPFTHGLCSDGTYIYGVATTDQGSGILRNLAVYRFDPVTKEVVVAQQTAQGAHEGTAGVTYYDGKIIVYFNDGTRVATDAATFSTSSTFAAYDGFTFKGWETQALADVYYNQAAQKFVVMSYTHEGTSFATRIYDKNMTDYVEMELRSTTGSKRLTGDSKYIYVNNTTNGTYQPTVDIYDWTGTYIGRVTVPNTLETLGLTSGQKGSCNIQGIAFHGGDLYFSAIKWTGGSTTSIVRSTLAEEAFAGEATGVDYTVGERVDIGLNPGTSSGSVFDIGSYAVTETAPELTTEVVKDWSVLGNAFAHGLCTDGTYLYGTTTTSGTTRTCVVYRYDPATGSVVTAPATSASITENTGGITYYNGKLILYFNDGTRVATDAASFGSASAFTAYNDFNFEGWASQRLGDVYYNATAQKYAVLANTGSNAFAMRIYDADKTTYTTVTMKNASGSMRMTGDKNYIYVNLTANGRIQPTMDVYTWSGEYVKTITLPNSTDILGYDVPNSMNMQGVTVLNDSFYFVADKWGDSTASITQGAMILKTSKTSEAGETPTTPTLGQVTLDMSMMEDGRLPISSGSIADVVSDGAYYYVSVTQDGGKLVCVYKIDAEALSVVAITKKLAYDDYLMGGGSHLFIQDNTLYMISETGKTYTVDLDAFTQGCELKESERAFNMPSGVITDMIYNGDVDAMAMLSNNQQALAIMGNGLNPVDIDLSQYVNDLTAELIAKNNFNKVSVGSITSDNSYVYVTFEYEGQTEVPMLIFDWQGNKIGGLYRVSGFNASGDLGSEYQLSSIFTSNGKLMAVASSSTSSASYLWEVKTTPIV